MTTFKKMASNGLGDDVAVDLRPTGSIFSGDDYAAIDAAGGPVELMLAIEAITNNPDYAAHWLERLSEMAYARADRDLETFKTMASRYA